MMTALEVYERFARYYDQYVGGFSQDIPLYLNLCSGASKVLEVGCGSGRVLGPLLAVGHSVTGVDISQAMLFLARRRLADYIASGKLTLLEHDFRTATFREQFAVAIVTFYTFNYLLNDIEAGRFLSNIRESLQSGGQIALDLFFPKTFTDPSKDNVWEEARITNDGKVVLLTQKRKTAGRIEERVQRFSSADGEEQIVTTRRFYSKADVHQLLERSGFSDIAFTDGYDCSSFRALHAVQPAASSFVVKAARLS